MPIEYYFRTGIGQISASASPVTIAWHGYYLTSPIISLEEQGEKVRMIFVRPGSTIATVEIYLFFKNQVVYSTRYPLYDSYYARYYAPYAEIVRVGSDVLAQKLIDNLNIGINWLIDVPNFPNQGDTTYLIPFHRGRILPSPISTIAKKTQFCVGTISKNQIEELVTTGNFDLVEIEDVVENSVSLSAVGDARLQATWNYTVPFFLKNGKIWKVKFEGTVEFCGGFSSRQTNNYTCF